MIPKIWCWLFGHKIWTEIFTGETTQITNWLDGGVEIIPVVKPKRNDVCPRCDAKIQEPK